MTEQEIEKAARLMRIELSDHSEHVERVRRMLDYFDILDRAGAEDEEIGVREVPISGLREDRHEECPPGLIGRLHNYKGAYVRAPKMM